MTVIQYWLAELLFGNIYHANRSATKVSPYFYSITDSATEGTVLKMIFPKAII